MLRLCIYKSVRRMAGFYDLLRVVGSQAKIIVSQYRTIADLQSKSLADEEEIQMQCDIIAEQRHRIAVLDDRIEDLVSEQAINSRIHGGNLGRAIIRLTHPQVGR